MDILSKANSIVSEYDQIMQQMMDNDIMLNQDKMTSLSRQKSALDESYQLCKQYIDCLLYTSPSPRDQSGSRMPSSA